MQTPPRKSNVGDDFHVKTDELYNTCIAYGMTHDQAHTVQGLVDHESAGTWDHNITGDGGYSRGIAQWYSLAGRIAPDTFVEQVDLICSEMKAQFDKYPYKEAITNHNCPACIIKHDYVNKVLKSKSKFN